jgi:hypothetical protein
MKVYVGTYRKWNNRNLAGEWLNIRTLIQKRTFSPPPQRYTKMKQILN